MTGNSGRRATVVAVGPAGVRLGVVVDVELVEVDVLGGAVVDVLGAVVVVEVDVLGGGGGGGGSVVVVGSGDSVTSGHGPPQPTAGTVAAPQPASSSRPATRASGRTGQ